MNVHKEMIDHLYLILYVFGVETYFDIPYIWFYLPDSYWLAEGA